MQREIIIMTLEKTREALENFKSIRFDSKATEYGFILYRDHDGVLVSYSDHISYA